MTALPDGGEQRSQPTKEQTRNSAMVPPGPSSRPTSSADDRSQEAKEQQKETFRIIKEMSDILKTGLDTQSLACCLRLCEDGGVNPVALARFIKDWKLQQPQQQGHKS